MEEFADRYGSHFMKLVDSCASGKEFEFDQVLLMPTAAGYRALVEQARIEINPRIMQYLSRRWSEGAIENLSFFAMAVAVYARSVSDPPYPIDVGKVLLRTAAFCNQQVRQPKRIRRWMPAGHEQGGTPSSQMHKNPQGCCCYPELPEEVYRNRKSHELGRCGVHEAMSVKVDPGSDFAPATSC